MLDKKGKELNVGDSVKAFTYKGGTIVGFINGNQCEVAIVRVNRIGICVIYSEEIEKCQKDKKK